MPIFLCIRIEFISHSLFALPLLCHPPLSPSTHLLTPPPLLSRYNSFTLPSSLLVYCDMLFAQTPHSPCPICQPLPKPSHTEVYCKKHTLQKNRERERGAYTAWRLKFSRLLSESCHFYRLVCKQWGRHVYKICKNTAMRRDLTKSNSMYASLPRGISHGMTFLSLSRACLYHHCDGLTICQETTNKNAAIIPVGAGSLRHWEVQRKTCDP